MVARVSSGGTKAVPEYDSSDLATVRIRIKKLPALRYEGFDLSSFQIGVTYEVERRLAELLIERGLAEPETRSDCKRAAGCK